MLTSERQILLEALDTLGVALADKDHQWTFEQRHLYERAVRIVKAVVPYDPLTLSLDASTGNLIAYQPPKFA
jgi:hypothetical protein